MSLAISYLYICSRQSYLRYIISWSVYILVCTVKLQRRIFSLSRLLEKRTSIACLFRSGLKDIFLWKAHLLIFARLEMGWEFELFLSITFEKKDVSSAKILHIQVNPSEKSLKQIKSRSGPKTEPCGIPA